MSAPLKCPETVRLCRAGDEKPLFDLCMTAFGDNGWGGCDAAAVRSVISRAIKGEVVMAVIPGPDRLEAVAGFQPSKLWYGDEASWFWTELLVFVHPLHRRSRHFSKLMQFTGWFAHIADAPVLISVMPKISFEAKQRVFSRYGKFVTATYSFGDGEFRYMKKEAA